MKVKRPLLGAVLMGILAASVAFGDAGRTAEQPTIDGRLDEACWTAAEWHSDFMRPGDDAAKGPLSRSTAFAIVSDEHNLYVGVRCAEKDVARLKGGDFNIWSADTIELFFAPTGSNFDFYQFAAAPNSKSTYAQFYSEGGVIHPDPFAPRWEHAFAFGEKEWTAEFRIPLSSFYMTRNEGWKTEWLVNVTRGFLAPREDATWSPIEHGSKESKKFRKLGGFPMRSRGDDFAVKSVFPELTGMRDGEICGELALDVYTAEAGEYEATLSAGRIPRKLALVRGENRVKVPCRYKANGNHPTHITFVRASDGATFERDYPVRVDFQPIRVKLTTPAYRNNFYPGQPTDRVAGTVESVGGGAVELTLEGPGFPTRTVTVSGKGDFSFDTKGFQVGDAWLKVRADGEERKIRIRNLPPTGHLMVWIENGCLVANGKPTIRRKIDAEHYRGGKKFNEIYDGEIDTYHQTLLLGKCVTLEPFRLVKTRNIEREEAIYDRKPSQELFDRIDEAMAKVKDDDFCAYNLSDEPECRGLSPVYLKYVYDYVSEKDPYHPIWSDSRGGKTYVECLDWVQTHPYLACRIQPDGSRSYGVPPNRLGDYIDAFGLGDRPDKCVGSVPTCFAYRWQSTREDYPTFDEYMLNCWTHLNHGAKSIAPYAYHDLGDRPQLYFGTKFIFESIEALEPFFLRGRRTLLERNDEWESAVFELPDEKLLTVVNFTQSDLTVKLPPLKDSFREFRGTRTVGSRSSGSKLQASIFKLKPHETFVATTRPHDAGLKPVAEVRAAIEKGEYARTHRDNQLLERYDDIALDTNIDSSNSGGSFYKLIDGMYDQLGYQGFWKDTYFMELAFTKFTATFRKIRVHGSGLFDTVRVSVRQGGAWRTLEPVAKKTDRYLVELDFGKPVTTVKMRLEFTGKKGSRNELELYEIELPRVAGAAKAAAVRTVAAEDRDVLWKLTGKDATTSLRDSRTHWQVRRLEKDSAIDPLETVKPSATGGFVVDGFACRDLKSDPEHDWLVIDLKGCHDLPGKHYRSWVTLFGPQGLVCRTDTYLQPGLYTIKLGTAAASAKEELRLYLYGLVAEFNSISLVGEPANRIELTVPSGKDEVTPGDTVGVKVVLAEPCADLVAEFTYASKKINGMQAFPVNGTHGIDLKALDKEGRVWGADVRIDSCGTSERRSVFVKVQTLGGGLERPLFANFPLAFAGK